VDRALPSGGRGHRFDSYREYQFDFGFGILDERQFGINEISYKLKDLPTKRTKKAKNFKHFADFN
jgi:hypothetical protein